jgi:hypothetical protein
VLRSVNINIISLGEDPFMIGKLDPEERVMNYKTEIYSQVGSVIKELGWEDDDDVVVEVGGVAATGTATHPDANPKWAKPYGSISYQKDAFIVIKNKSRNPVVTSQPNPELKQHHS